jgi:hypothetical protein
MGDYRRDFQESRLKSRSAITLDDRQLAHHLLKEKNTHSGHLSPNQGEPLPCEEKRVILVDLEKIENRAQLISKYNWKNFVDWMGFQCAKDSNANGVIYYKNKTVMRMAGSVLFARKEGLVFYLDTVEGLNGLEKNHMEDMRQRVQKAFSQNGQLKNFQLVKKAPAIEDLLASDEIWALQVRKGIISIINILNTAFQKEKSGEITSLLAGELKS